jgi:transcriptional regulator with XRE-family HTH domain
MEIFSSRLKWLREKNKMSQKEMADKLGISQPYYGRIERNMGEPNLEALKKLPDILGESVDFMLGVTDNDTETVKLLDELMSFGMHAMRSFERFKDIKVLELRADAAGNEKEVTLARYELDELGTQIAKLFQKAQEISLLAERKLDEIPFLSKESKEALNGIYNSAFKDDSEIKKWIDKRLEKQEDPQ